MSKRYVFWRKPTGEPYLGTDDKHAPVNVLNRLGTSAKVNSDNSISWSSFELYRDKLVVKSLIVVIDLEGEETNQPDAWSIVWDSILEELKKSGEGKPLHATSLLQRADRKASAYFRKRKQNYVVVTSISLAQLPKKRIRINNCEVAQLRERGLRYPLPDSLNSFSASGMFREHVNSSKYATVRVNVSARTV